MSGLVPGIRRRGHRLGCLVLIGAFLTAAGCAQPATSSQSAPEVVRWSSGAVLRQPVWSYRLQTLIALTDDNRLVEVTPGADHRRATTRSSAPLAVGRNLQISQRDDLVVFVPQPERGTVARVNLETLHQVGAFDAGPSPAYLSEDAGMRILLALSSDGRSVTPVDQYGFRKLRTAVIEGAAAERIDGANRGRQIDYHLYDASGIRYFRGPSSPPLERGSLGIDVAVAAGDGAAVARSYVAGHDSNVLYAVDSRRGGAGLEVLASAQLPSPIRYLATDSTRIYAATDHELVVLETNSFTGFAQHTIPVIRVVPYRAGPTGAAGALRVSGMAVGPHRVHLTLADSPDVVSIAKPKP